MFIVLLDEPGLFVYDSSDSAAADIESIDVNESLRAAFDDHAVPHAVLWPHSRPIGDRVLGLQVTENVEYRFAAAGPPDLAALIGLLSAHAPSTYPEAARELVTELLGRLRAQVGPAPTPSN